MLQLQAWMTAMYLTVRGRVDDAVERDREEGANTMEYVIIAAAVFIAAVAVVGVITGVINREKDKIQ
ncbi:MAG TPA: hypothetical protein VIP77_07910 [Jiangellaceae bacterium]